MVSINFDSWLNPGDPDTSILEQLCEDISLKLKHGKESIIRFGNQNSQFDEQSGFFNELIRRRGIESLGIKNYARDVETYIDLLTEEKINVDDIKKTLKILLNDAEKNKINAEKLRDDFVTFKDDFFQIKFNNVEPVKRSRDNNLFKILKSIFQAFTIFSVFLLSIFYLVYTYYYKWFMIGLILSIFLFFVPCVIETKLEKNHDNYLNLEENEATKFLQHIEGIKNKLPAISDNLNILVQFWNQQIYADEQHIRSLESLNANEEVKLPHELGKKVKDIWKEIGDKNINNHRNLNSIITRNSMLG
ncbi:2871_t:CDS:1 [Diversispora eburnea]|uniref:2871_t:CDS:1 n=1 Tax=Diversispora eburnea TaxID=1213867 RepID=A0A9N9CII5_9GLOM|nr:2871_t:CDS:1 [Diversispora eburnea]